ncbi:MAG: patatin-like phospholipase family protein, partial [Aquabacterium sp.]|nr:patatin-like phospholipase family protein [Aquabacterium sp.]
MPQLEPLARSRSTRRALLLGAGGALLLPGCSLDADRDHDGADAPQAAPLPTAPRVAWVFGSGGPRGFVHVGVLKALAELQLQPDVIVGASAGALVGTLYAAGLDAAAIERQALDLQPWQLLRWQLVGTERWAADGLASWVNQQLDARPLQALPTPMVCAAQRLRDGAVIGFSRGNAGLAVQASSAIEGQLAPLTIRRERYADADLRMPLPVRLARALGATRVLAVDASAHEDRAPEGARSYREGDLRKRALTRPDALLADVLLHPDFGYWVSLSREFRERAIAAGYRATLADAARLQALHAR